MVPPPPTADPEGGYIPHSPPRNTADSSDTESKPLIPLSEPQQARVINYLDEQLLGITRNYVRRFRDPSDQQVGDLGNNDDSKGYQTLAALNVDFSRLIDFVWYSRARAIESSLQSSSSYLQETGYNSISSFLFSQVQRLLTMADSYIDYLTGYHSPPEPQVFLPFLRVLDVMFAAIVSQHHLSLDQVKEKAKELERACQIEDDDNEIDEADDAFDSVDFSKVRAGAMALDEGSEADISLPSIQDPVNSLQGPAETTTNTTHGPGQASQLSIDLGGQILPTQFQVSRTELVRLSSIVNETRVAVVNVLSATNHADISHHHQVEVSRVYQLSLEALG